MCNVIINFPIVFHSNYIVSSHRQEDIVDFHIRDLELILGSPNTVSPNPVSPKHVSLSNISPIPVSPSHVSPNPVSLFNSRFAESLQRRLSQVSPITVSRIQFGRISFHRSISVSPISVLPNPVSPNNFRWVDYCS